MAPAKVVGGTSAKETNHFAVTMIAAHESASRQLTRECDKIDALNLIGTIAREDSPMANLMLSVMGASPSSSVP